MKRRHENESARIPSRMSDAMSARRQTEGRRRETPCRRGRRAWSHPANRAGDSRVAKPATCALASASCPRAMRTPQTFCPSHAAHIQPSREGAKRRAPVGPWQTCSRAVCVDLRCAQCLQDGPGPAGEVQVEPLFRVVQFEPCQLLHPAEPVLQRVAVDEQLRRRCLARAQLVEIG